MHYQYIGEGGGGGGTYTVDPSTDVKVNECPHLISGISNVRVEYI